MTTLKTLATELGFDTPTGCAPSPTTCSTASSDRAEVPADVEQILRDAAAQATADQDEE